MKIHDILTENNDNDWPIAGNEVSGLDVSDHVPNMGSIASSLDDYEILNNVREVPLSVFTLSGKSYSVSETERIESLADEIKENGWIDPLIIVIDDEGPYILEGGHRAEALYLLGIKTFPALVVLEQ